MNRSLGMERTFTLGNYKNLKVYDSIDNIPSELMLNNEFINTLRMLQILKLDETYFNYVQTSPSMMDGVTAEQAIEMIEEVTTSTTEKMNKAIASLKD